MAAAARVAGASASSAAPEKNSRRPAYGAISVGKGVGTSASRARAHATMCSDVAARADPGVSETPFKHGAEQSDTAAARGNVEKSLRTDPGQLFNACANVDLLEPLPNTSLTRRRTSSLWIKRSCSSGGGALHSDSMAGNPSHRHTRSLSTDTAASAE